MFQLDNFSINAAEDGSELRLLSPLNRSNLTVNDMLGNPFGKAVWTARNLGTNPAYDSLSTVAAGAALNAPLGGGGGGGNSFAGINTGTTSGSMPKVDRIVAPPDCNVVAVSFERILRLVSADTKTVVAEIWMEEKILNMRCNNDILAVILSKATHFFHLETMMPLPELRTQCHMNHNGLGALSPMLGMNCYFAVNQSLSEKKDRGDIFLYNPVSAATLTVIDAHDEPVRCLEFCPNGSKFASCSKNGKKVRVWSCPDCAPLYELQRGQSEAVIYSLGMNFDGTVLALTSNSGTLHLFRPQTNNRSVGKITTRQSPNLTFVSPDGEFLFVLYPPDSQSKTAKVERYKLGRDLKPELENEMNLTV